MKDRQILFVGVAASKPKIKDINEQYYMGIDRVLPQQNFDFNLVSGLSNNVKVKALSEQPIESFPRAKSLFIRGSTENISDRLIIRYMPSINIKVLKQIFYSIWLFIYILFFTVRYRRNTTVVLGYISIYTFLPALLAKTICRNLLVVIVPDLPRFSYVMEDDSKSMRRFSSRISSKIQNKGDAYVFLTQAMNDEVNTKNKPYIIMEGFVSEELTQTKQCPIKYRNPVIMYAGTTNKKFGIGRLVEAFSLIAHKWPDMELHIYGSGDFSDKDLSSFENISDRIKLMGTRSKDEIFELECSSWLLINPRPSSEEFTKYSFPSKTMEYLASGTPFLCTPLSGISEDYWEHIIKIQDESAEGMGNAIDQQLKSDYNVILHKAAEGQEYVFNYKTLRSQTKRVYGFIKNLGSEKLGEIE